MEAIVSHTSLVASCLCLSVSRLLIWNFWEAVRPGVITPSDTLYIIDKKHRKKVTVRKDEGIKIWCWKTRRGKNAELKPIRSFKPAESLHVEVVLVSEKQRREAEEALKKFLWDDLGPVRLHNQLWAETNSQEEKRANEAGRFEVNGRSTFAGLQQIESGWIFAEKHHRCAAWLKDTSANQKQLI